MTLQSVPECCGRLKLPVFFALSLYATVYAADVPQASALLAASARRVLESYRADSPLPANKKLRLICWRTREREFPADYRARLQRIMENIRDFYGSEMARNGLGRLTFQLDYDASGKLVIYEATGSGTFDDYTKQEGGKPIREDCWRVLREAGLDPDQETVVIFTNLAKWDPQALTFNHHSPYMGSGGSRNGIAWQLDHPGLDTRNLTLKAPLIRDGEYGRISLGKHNSIFIGGIAHELGHALGLPHCRESDAESKTLGTALMGSGNRTYGDPLRGEGLGTFLTLSHALRLASHPLFSRSAKGLDQKAEARFTGLSVTAGLDAFTVSGSVSSGIPVYAVAAYMDPEGHSDYDARTAPALVKADGSFVVRCTGLVAGKSGALRLCALHANGSVSKLQSEYRVAKDGAPDVSAMEVSFALEKFLAALDQRDLRQAAAIRDTLPSNGRAARVASALLSLQSGNHQTCDPASVPQETKALPLSRLTPTLAQVGWGRPTYDRLPDRNALLIAGGELFENGLYAHAPATYRYGLSGGWKRLSGTCGLPSADGSVVFVVRTDGKEALRTGTLKSGRTHTFSIDLAGVRELELLTEDAGDGNRSDWGLWLDMRLER